MTEAEKRDFDFPENYHSSQELVDDFDKFCSQYPELISKYKLGQSTEEKDIWGYIITAGQDGLKNKPACLIIGCHHGRECITSEAVYYGINYLLENYSKNEEIQNLIEKGLVIVIPMLNPDGHDIVIRRNGNRVDLNRNYTFNWGNQPGCSHDPLSEIYCGPTQLSEIESQLMNELKIIDDLFQKYKNIKCAIDLHSGAEVILYPWGYTWDPSPDDSLFQKLCKQMAQKSQNLQVAPYPSQPGIALYPTAGTFIDHVYKFYECISFVVEIYKGTWAGDIWEFFNPPSEQVDVIGLRTLPILLTAMEFAVGKDSPIIKPPGIWSRIVSVFKTFISKLKALFGR